MNAEGHAAFGLHVRRGHTKLGGLWRAEPSCYVEHRVWEESGYKCAFQEGIADYFGDVGAGPEYGGWENPRSVTGIEGKVEGRVAALFHDLIDAANENDDKTTHQPREDLRSATGRLA